jgi:CBS domain containing-hemolysin-like protein
MKVEQFMVPVAKVEWRDEKASIGDITELFINSSISCCVICKKDGDNIFPLGMVSKTDLVKAYSKSIPLTEAVGNIMTSGVISVKPSATRDEAAEVLQKNKVHHAVVTDGDQATMVGLISSWDIARECSLDAAAWPYNRDLDLNNVTL